MGTTTEELLRLAQQLSQPDQGQPQQMQSARPSTIVGLLGSALGGGSSGNVPLTQDQAESEGRSALLNFGLNMLEGSGPSPQRRGLGQIVAGGIRGAQGAIGDYESQIAARQAAVQQQQQQQIENRLRGIDSATKLADLQQKLRALQISGQPMSDPLSGGGGTGGGGGPDPVAGMSKEDARAAIAQRESGNQNIFSQIKVPGRSQEELGSGYYQIIPSTWREGAQLAGVDVSKYPLAINAPKEVQDKVFDALWGKYGAKPWARSAPQAAPSGATSKTAATTPAPAGPQIQMGVPGGPTPAPPGGPAGAPGTPYTGGGIGAQLNKPVVRGSPVPAGVLQSTGKPPGVASADQVSPVVAAIEEGRAGARATPDVPGAVQAAGPAAGTPPAAVPASEAGWGSKPGTYGAGPVAPAAASAAPAAPTVTPSPAQQPPAAPGTPDVKRADQDLSFEEYKQRYPIVFSDQEKQLLAQSPGGAELAAIAQEKKDAAAALQRAEASRQAGSPSGASDYSTAIKTYNDALENERKAFAEARTQGNTAAATMLKDKENLAHTAWQQLQAAKTDRLKDAEHLLNESTQKKRDDLAAEVKASTTRINSLEGMRVLSDQLGPGMILQDQEVGGRPAYKWIEGANLGTEDYVKHMRAADMFKAGIANFTKEMRQGLSLGGQSDAELRWLQNMGPQLSQDPATRQAIIGYMLNFEHNKLKVASRVDELMTGRDESGRPMTYIKAMEQARNEAGPVVPTIPDRIAKSTDLNEVNAWYASHAPLHTMYYDAGGNLRIHLTPQEEARLKGQLQGQGIR